MTITEKKWHEKPTSIVLLLILFFPVGLFLMWKNNIFSKKIRIFVSIFCGLIILGSGGDGDSSSKLSSGDGDSSSKLSSADLIGQTFTLDAYHVITFQSETTYYIKQKPYNCGGDGYWSMSGNKVILNSNSSKCESTRNKKGEYNISLFK